MLASFPCSECMHNKQHMHLTLISLSTKSYAGSSGDAWHSDSTLRDHVWGECTLHGVCKNAKHFPVSHSTLKFTRYIYIYIYIYRRSQGWGNFGSGVKWAEWPLIIGMFQRANSFTWYLILKSIFEPAFSFFSKYRSGFKYKVRKIAIMEQKTSILVGLDYNVACISTSVFWYMLLLYVRSFRGEQ